MREVADRFHRVERLECPIVSLVSFSSLTAVVFAVPEAADINSGQHGAIRHEIRFSPTMSGETRCPETASHSRGPMSFSDVACLKLAV